jgi:hypothetical protein
MVSEPLLDLALPFDLSSLLSFTLVNSFAQDLANSSCNNFFESYKAEDGSGRIRVRQEGERRCWGLLPVEWRQYFEGIQDQETRDKVLRQLSLAEAVSTSSVEP